MTSTTIRKLITRLVRYNPYVERLRYHLHRGKEIRLDAIGLKIVVLPGDIVLDCGANVGDVASKFARTGVKVYAFEPNNLCFGIIKNRFSLMPNVHCLHNGLMDSNCSLTLNTPEPHANFDALDTTVAASFKSDAVQSSDYASKQESVECLDADNFIRSLGKRVRLMKIDIEGAEIEVINRLLDTQAIDFIDYMVVETHEKQMPHLLEKTKALRSRIQSLGLANKINLDWY